MDPPEFLMTFAGSVVTGSCFSVSETGAFKAGPRWKANWTARQQIWNVGTATRPSEKDDRNHFNGSESLAELFRLFKKVADEL
jgi:hypothetical protein